LIQITKFILLIHGRANLTNKQSHLSNQEFHRARKIVTSLLSRSRILMVTWQQWLTS